MLIFHFAEEFLTLKQEKDRLRQRGALRTQRTAKDLADLLIGAADKFGGGRERGAQEVELVI